MTLTAMYDSQYESEEEVDAWFAQEVAIEFKDFVEEILEESPEAITAKKLVRLGLKTAAVSRLL